MGGILWETKKIKSGRDPEILNKNLGKVVPNELPNHYTNKWVKECTLEKCNTTHIGIQHSLDLLHEGIYIISSWSST